LLAFSGLQDRDLSILFVNNKRIRAFNKQFFNKDLPTNVISFGYEDSLPGQILGDIIISLERAREEADRASISFYERLFSLIIHGLLHIGGLHHEQDPVAARKMRHREKILLNYILAHDLYKKIVR
jgi:rRNA maturation RNase YbeY